ncbi:helix-turn-helix domain-containing protein [Chryseobacterium sp. C-71]|jgi:transcriptional regulator with XRE-family HTH domain|uniref:helix-turn-helix transcriptional regulator n=1 Tax=Chryseobacterium sp. C-71 TaxID=2893882 RepID=UPI001E530258|nr:helix-turn-helix transcriptional regulator [Chryseobacterium sp. C-71]UFH30512.1 helix-turn-helix domain-containing protein [Chryseobacterium sp. C-71]
MGIGTNLKRLRNKTKYSNQDIADLLGIDRNTYANWESETTDIKSQYIPKLADIFNVKIQDLFDDDRKVEISNNTFDNKDNSVGLIIFNISDKAVIDNFNSKLEELIKGLKP